MSELLEVVNERGEVIGKAYRHECHGNPDLAHCTAHVVVWSSAGDLLLQKRSDKKDMFPGKWDTAVGGHLAPGETYEVAARRELEEELGVPAPEMLPRVCDLRVRNDWESEHVRVFSMTHDGPFYPPPEEIEELAFWSCDSLVKNMGTGIFTPNLETELQHIVQTN